MKLGLAAIGRSIRLPTTMPAGMVMVGWPLALRLICPLRPVLAGMPLGLAVPTTLAGAVPFDAPSVSQKASLVAFQVSGPPPGWPLGGGEVGTWFGPAGRDRPHRAGPS